MSIKFDLPLFVLLAGIFCSVALAETGVSENEPVLEEVLVSAMRKASSRNVDASITVIEKTYLESLPVQHFQDLSQQIPNLNTSGEGSRARYFQLRGVGELEQYEGAPNPSVGFIIDDIDLSGVGGVSNLFDIQQIEVLRGPQATRFGANAIAGLVYVQSAEAVADGESMVKISSGSDGAREFGVSMGGALGENVNGRLSVHQSESDGYYDNVSLGAEDTNGRDEFLARGKLFWSGVKGWTASISFLYADFDNGYDAWSPENGRISYANQPGRDEQETTGAAVKLSKVLQSGNEFVSITSYADSDILFSYDGEWGDAALWAPYVYDYAYRDDRKRNTLSQEFRLISTPETRLFDGKTAWLLGVYFQSLDESNRILSTGIYDDSADEPFSYCAPCLDRNTLNSDYDSDNLAVFGSLETDISDRLTLTTGIRVERWKAGYHDEYIDEIYGDPDTPARNSFSPSETLWGGNISIRYDLSDQSSLYGLISRGYKAGGFNPSLARALGSSPFASPADIAFDPEALWNMEAGLKGNWLDGELRGEFSVFYMDRKDMQLRSSAQYTNNPNDFIYVTSNAQGHVWGVEATADWQFSQNWTLHSNLGLLNTRVDAYQLEREADISGELVGREFAHAPAYTLNLGLSYEQLTVSGASWTARLDFNAIDSFYFDYSHDEKAAARQLVNLKIGRAWEQWEVSAWVRNLFDEDYHTRGFSFGLSPPFFERTRFTRLGDPRQYGITASYRFP